MFCCMVILILWNHSQWWELQRELGSTGSGSLFSKQEEHRLGIWADIMEINKARQYEMIELPHGNQLSTPVWNDRVAHEKRSAAQCCWECRLDIRPQSFFMSKWTTVLKLPVAYYCLLGKVKEKISWVMVPICKASIIFLWSQATGKGNYHLLFPWNLSKLSPLVTMKQREVKQRIENPRNRHIKSHPITKPPPAASLICFLLFIMPKKLLQISH